MNMSLFGYPSTRESDLDPLGSARERIGPSLLLAVAIHGVLILGVGFSLPTPPAPPIPALDITLLALEATEQPQDYRHIAAKNQRSGGRQAVLNRPNAPANANGTSLAVGNPPTRSTPQTTTTIPLLFLSGAPVRATEPLDLGPTGAIAGIPSAPTSHTASPPSHRHLPPDGRGHHGQNAMAAESAVAADEADYLAAWTRQAEQFANLNFPETIRHRNLAGQVVLAATMGTDGEVLAAEIVRSSGSSLLDETVLWLVRLAAPYPPLPMPLRDKYHGQFVVLRNWVVDPGIPLATRVH